MRFDLRVLSFPSLSLSLICARSILFGKIESYVKMVTEQIRFHHDFYPKVWEAYAPKALSEYKAYLSRYYQWEAEGMEYRILFDITAVLLEERIFSACNF